MKNLMISVLIFLSMANAFADEAPITHFVVNPQTLRERFLSDSTTVFSAANQVHKAKDQLNLARTQLLPSINLGALLGTMVNPTFVLASVEYTLPFLIPSKWFQKASAKRLMEAERVAFLVSELNVYSSLYSLYIQILSDFKSREFVAQDLRDVILIENIVAREYELGEATEQDLQLTRSETMMAKVRLNRFEELLVQEIATLRESIDLPQETQIEFAGFEMISSPLEDLDLAPATDMAKNQAPEYEQIRWLVEAAKWERWSGLFGFISSASASNQLNPMAGQKHASTAFNAQSGSYGFHFGFDYFPALSLSNRNRDTLTLRSEEMNGEISNLVETLLGRMQYVQKRKQEANQSEAAMRSVFENERRQFAIGQVSLRELLVIQGKARQAALESLRADTDVNLIRVALHRLIRTDQFALFYGCENLPDVPVEKTRWWQFWRWYKSKDAPICNPDAVEKKFSGGQAS